MQNCRGEKSFLQIFLFHLFSRATSRLQLLEALHRLYIYRSISKRKRCGGQHFEQKFTPHNVSHVMCHMSSVMCQVLGVKYPFFCCCFFKWWSMWVECLLSTGPTPSFLCSYYYFLDIGVELVGWGLLSTGLPCLVKL